MHEVSVADEIKQLEMQAPHVVLLGAGASRAAFPGGEKNGKHLPLMFDFGQIVPIGEVLDEIGIDYQGRNFEDVYAEISSDSALASQCVELEELVFDYFSELELPDSPTIYDYLVLSLRPNDIIATFNWDPFLIQAVRRCHNRIGSPQLLFLHGNVLSGYCATDQVHGVRGGKCSHCGKAFSPSQLLFPVTEKNYEESAQIVDAWRMMKHGFKHAFMVTIFGYGAPASDVAAMDTLRGSWGAAQSREMEQFEIVDIRDEEELRESWSDFIHTHHYDVHSDIFDSWVLKHPRRTGEAYINQYLRAKFIEDNPVPRGVSLSELQLWYQPLLDVEASAA